MNEPYWFPRNPYPEDIFPMSIDKYPQVVPDDSQRTALSGCLGRWFWEMITEDILECMYRAYREDPEAFIAELDKGPK